MLTLEVPLCCKPLPLLARLQGLGFLRLVLYGGFPGSPINGGRVNQGFDGLVPAAEASALLAAGGEAALGDLLGRARAAFYARAEAANTAGLPLYLAFTSMLVSARELDEELAPVARLVELGAAHGVKNGVIFYDDGLASRLRQRFGEGLALVSSCTRHFLSDRLLSRSERLARYLADAERADRVVLTHQDSRDAGLMRELVPQLGERLVAICNTYCAAACNSYDHYLMLSEGNKLRPGDLAGMLAGALRFHRRAGAVCTVPLCAADLPLAEHVERQLACGVRAFKLGRGAGDDRLDELVGLFATHHVTQPSGLPM